MPSAKFYLIDNSAPPKWTCAFDNKHKTPKKRLLISRCQTLARAVNKQNPFMPGAAWRSIVQITYFVVHALNVWSIEGDVTINLCFEWKPFAGRRPFDEQQRMEYAKSLPFIMPFVEFHVHYFNRSGSVSAEPCRMSASRACSIGHPVARFQNIFKSEIA